MAHQRADIDELIEDKNIYIDNQDQCINEGRKIKIASSAAVLEREIDSSSIGKQPASDTSHHPEVAVIGDGESDSLVVVGRSANKFEESTKANQDLSTGPILRVEKDINIRVKLKCLLKIDASSNNYVGKMLTSVQCESAIPDFVSSSRRKGDSSSNDDAKLVTEDSTHIRSLRESVQRTKKPVTKTAKADNDNEWTNINLLTTTLMKFANSEIHDIDIQSGFEENVDRPLERIHFSTPEAEQKWRKIVEEVTHEGQKCSQSNAATKISRTLLSSDSQTTMPTLSLRRKRKFSEASTENQPDMPPAQEKASNSESKAETQIIAILGPIPRSGSNIFRGMSFILECVSLESIDPQQLETMESNSEAENLEEWTRRPFVRDRLIAQVNAGGGKLYDRSELVPPDKYANTKLIMNIPNITANSLFCLSVGIEAYSHQWIIRCCQENKIVNPAEERLPSGWSLMRQSYVEMYQRPSQKPFQSDLPFVVVIPMHPSKKQFVSFWEQVIGNAGGAVLLVKEPEDDFMEGTVVLTHSCIPMWVIQMAKNYDIPLVTTQWAIQCLIEGQICDYDAHPSFEYHLKR